MLEWGDIRAQNVVVDEWGDISPKTAWVEDWSDMVYEMLGNRGGFLRALGMAILALNL